MKAAIALGCTKVQLVGTTLPISWRWLRRYCFCADHTGNCTRSSSPFPVKYVPNKSKPTATSLHFDAAAADGAQSHPRPQPQRDSEHQFDRNSATDDHEVFKGPLLGNCQLPLAQPHCIENRKMKEEIELSAIKLLASRAYTAVELRKKLQQRRSSLDVIQAVISDFQKRGLINDCLYAESFCRSRWSSSAWGPTRIKQALFRKGVSEVDSEKAIKMVFKDGESDGDKDFIHGLSVSSMDRLYVQAAKHWLRSRDVPRETQKSRIIRWLQYRGFNWFVISHVVKKLENEYTT